MSGSSENNARPSRRAAASASRGDDAPDPRSARRRKVLLLIASALFLAALVGIASIVYKYVAIELERRAQLDQYDQLVGGRPSATVAPLPTPPLLPPGEDDVPPPEDAEPTPTPASGDYNDPPLPVDGSAAIIGRLRIPKIKVDNVILIGYRNPDPNSATYMALLKRNLVRFWGPSDPSAPGNMVITGHNMLNGSLFGRLKNISIGDTVELYDLAGTKRTYTVTEKFKIHQSDQIALRQPDDGSSELTLLTCTSVETDRLCVRAVLNAQ